MDKLQHPWWETRHIFLCLLGKENHLHFISYLLLSSTVEMDFFLQCSHRLMERRGYISHQMGLHSIYVCSISLVFLALIVMSTFLSRSQSPCYFLPIYDDRVFVLLQVKYTGGGYQKQLFMLSSPWEAHTTETPILWMQLLTFPLPVLPEYEITP